MRSNNTKILNSALLLVSILLSACGGGGGSGGNTNAPAPSATDAIFKDAANPVNVTVTSDAARTATQVVTTAGATLTATSADGSQFTLLIPANAVTQDTTISMIPVTSMTGLPFANGLVAAVQFAPDGLFLEKDATLTIVPSVAVPVDKQTFIGYLGSGSDLHLVPPASPNAAIQMLVGHLSGLGLASGTSMERASMYLNIAEDYEVRLTQEMARILARERELAILGVNNADDPSPFNLEDLFKSYYELVVRARMLAASSSCANAKLALQTYLAFERKYQVLGIPNPHDPGDADYNKILKAVNDTCNGVPNRYTGTFTSELPGLYTSSGTVTFVRDDAACVATPGVLYDPNTAACYRTETVDFTYRMTNLDGNPDCAYSPASFNVQLSNTPVVDSYLVVDFASTPPTTLLQYTVHAHWAKDMPSGLTLTCYAGTPSQIVMTLDGAPMANFFSDPVSPPTTDGQQVQLDYSYQSYNFMWNLNGSY
jgi:hypothetical protein